MYQITSGNSVGMNQQHLGGGASIDKPAVPRDPNLIQNLAMLFAKKIPFYLPTVNITLASLLVTLPKIQPLTSQTLSFQVQSIGSGVILAANIEISLADPRSIKDIVTAALKEKKLLGLPDAFIFYGPDKEIINLEDMDVNGFSAGDRVTLTVQPIVWSPKKKQMIAAVTQDSYFLGGASAELKADKDVVFAAVRKYGRALECASVKLRADKDVVLAAVRQCGWAILAASAELRADREVVLAAVGPCGRALQYASAALKADKELVLAAVRQNGGALEHVSFGLINDRDVVFAAVRQDGRALRYVSQELRADKDVVFAAVRQNGSALKYASEGLRADKEVVLAAVRQNGRALEHASSKLQIDGDLLLVANPGWMST